MLVLAGKLPIRECDLPDQSAANLPLLETLIAIFAERPFFELNRWPPAIPGLPPPGRASA
jgi:hypothetical protein